MENMFCFQCEQTKDNLVCDSKKGICGKTPGNAMLQDQLISEVCILALALQQSKTEDKQATDAIIDGLFTTVTNVNFDDAVLLKKRDYIHSLSQKYALAPDVISYNIQELWLTEDADIRSLKSLILFGIKGAAAYYYHAAALGFESDEITQFIIKALALIAIEDDFNTLLSGVMETGKIGFDVMELLDKANTESYGNPTPTKVSMEVEKGPFIVVSGHDLHDLHLLLEQTKDKNINIYTHGEMLPCHAYPKLKEYAHLKGHFGTAWQNQRHEFMDIPAPVLFTTNCIMPVKKNYEDRIFTTAAVAYEGMVHIDEKKDFTPVIEKALELGGYNENTTAFTGINGGSELTTGFSHSTILSVADTIVEGVKSGDIRHFFLVGGCDGADPGRNYFTEFVKQTPKDSFILTLACGKYRFNDLDIGEIAGLPRILDMGQCNDAYGAVKVALALAEAFECGVNDLPLSLTISWYEQKAVTVLLALLYLGVENIALGPTLPAFVSENVLNFLVDKYKIKPISTPEQDIKAILEHF